MASYYQRLNQRFKEEYQMVVEAIGTSSNLFNDILKIELDKLFKQIKLTRKYELQIDRDFKSLKIETTEYSELTRILFDKREIFLDHLRFIRLLSYYNNGKLFKLSLDKKLKIINGTIISMKDGYGEDTRRGRRGCYKEFYDCAQHLEDAFRQVHPKLAFLEICDTVYNSEFDVDNDKEQVFQNEGLMKNIWQYV